MKSRDLKLSLETLRLMKVDALIAMREDIENVLSEKRMEIERSLSQIDGHVPRPSAILISSAGNGGTIH